MNEIKRTESNEELRANGSTIRAHRSKQLKLRINPLRGKEVFLTDNQTDQTKSSNEAKALDIERLQAEVRRLQKQNGQLRDSILKLKANEFYGINEQKVKNLIRQNENFKSQMRTLRNQLHRTMMQKDFLERNNRILKQRYEQFTKQNNHMVINSRLKTQQSRIKQYEFVQDVEDFFKQNRTSSKTKRSTSGERRKIVKKKVFQNLANKPEQKSSYGDNKKHKQPIQSAHFNEQYYLLRQTKSNPKKIYP